eukprot:Hpha_TRINITY_DN9922_c0_g1::TRINITY_DN9922_c0_g1_i1::g.140578::m.140578
MACRRCVRLLSRAGEERSFRTPQERPLNPGMMGVSVLDREKFKKKTKVRPEMEAPSPQSSFWYRVRWTWNELMRLLDKNDAKWRKGELPFFMSKRWLFFYMGMGMAMNVVYLMNKRREWDRLAELEPRLEERRRLLDPFEGPSSGASQIPLEHALPSAGGGLDPKALRRGESFR